VIFVGVGTFIHGFDELVEAADRAAAELAVPGFAQIGHSRVVPQHLQHERFLSPGALGARLRASRVAVCHAGMGLIGDALRAGCRLVLVPRRGATSSAHPANDQAEFARRLAARLDLRLCPEPAGLTPLVADALADQGPPPVPPGSDVPAILRRFLADGTVSPGLPRRRSRAGC
jgi:UDP-N-acetylglucosamine transferase subunit ALG13